MCLEQVRRFVALQSIVFISLLTTFLCHLGQVLSVDECINYTNITDPSRSVYDATSGGCDSTTFTGTSWIRFTGSGGAVVPEYAPPDYHCGANAPGWIRGGHPAVGDGVVERQLCFHHSGDICYFRHYYISIRNCGEFYVYRPPDITQCDLRICTFPIPAECSPSL
ncbi:pancreatic secretory granule membrane major glycoprotein GP2-like [Oculina patagonica]